MTEDYERSVSCRDFRIIGLGRGTRHAGVSKVCDSSSQMAMEFQDWRNMAGEKAWCWYPVRRRSSLVG